MDNEVDPELAAFKEVAAKMDAIEPDKFRSAARPRTSSSRRPPHRSFRRCGPLRADYTFGQALQGYSGAIAPARRRRRV
jgi:hypothetical protein